MFKKDFFLFGVVIGCVLPLLIAMATTFVNYKFLGNTAFDMYNNKPALMMSLVFNVILFRVFMVNLKKYNMGKGLLLVTLIFVFLIIIKP